MDLPAGAFAALVRPPQSPSGLRLRLYAGDIEPGLPERQRHVRRVRIKRSDFDQLVEKGYVSRPATSPPSIWDGEVPDAELPGS